MEEKKTMPLDSPQRVAIANALMGYGGGGMFGLPAGMNMPWGSGGAPAAPAVQPGSWLANMMQSGSGMFNASAPPAVPPPAAVAAPAAPPPPSFFGGGGMPQFGGGGYTPIWGMWRGTLRPLCYHIM